MSKEGYLNTNAHLETKVSLLGRALAESQARELRLREALRLCSGVLEEDGREATVWLARSALETTSDDSAMREMIETAVMAEREACAAVCDARYQFIGDGADHAIDECAKAILARKG